MASATLDISQTPRTPFHRLVRVELRKSYDTRAGFWLIASIALIVLIAEIVVLSIVAVQNEAVSFGDFVGTAKAAKYQHYRRSHSRPQT